MLSAKAMFNMLYGSADSTCAPEAVDSIIFYMAECEKNECPISSETILEIIAKAYGL